LLGIYPGNIVIEGDEFIIDGHRIKIIAESDPAAIAWNTLNIDWVVECTGKFTKREGAQKHLDSGAGHVLISAPAHDEDVTIIPGVNDSSYDPKKHRIVSLGSCTTNALAPILKVLHESFGVERAFMTTVHAYTNSQVLLDVETKDLRRSRAAALNMIPTSTGAMKVITKILPELAGRLEGSAIRVPVAKVSLIDLTFNSQKVLTVSDINDAYTRAANRGSLQNILAITQSPLVSSDFSGDPHSVVIDGLLTAVNGQYMGKVFGWYDNEWGYSVRLKDFLLKHG
jgi:glyceraldehyde 3-phosphate dehydrogenase